jgi:hypothetical protein
MMAGIIDENIYTDFDTEAFFSKRPFPYRRFHGFLAHAAFFALLEQFPALDLFEIHRGIKRMHGQRPHNRYYLAYQRSIHDRRRKSAAIASDSGPGVVSHQDLPEVWQRFIDELENSPAYQQFVCNFLQVEEYQARYEWHIATNGCEVSPHVDAPAKLGKHLFYFNNKDDWDSEWGGSIEILGGLNGSSMNPDFSDFKTSEAVSNMNNSSLIMKNCSNGWHGVRPLSSPDGKFRRVFLVVPEIPDADKLSLRERANYV